MKILHFADAHLGADDSGPIEAEGLSTRLSDFLESLEAVADYVEGQDIDLVLFCGDAFKTRTPTPTLVREWAKRISLMADYAPVVLVAGNHDLPAAFGKAHTLEIFDTLAVENVHVANRPRMMPIESRSGVVQVVAIPWPTRHNLMSMEKVQGLPVDELNKLIAEAVAQTIEGYARSLDPKWPAILAGHLSVAGGAFGSERSVMLGNDVILPLEAVARPEFDYVALGHLHRTQVLNEHPPVVYSGSIERIDFGEEKEDKGFVVVTIKEHKPVGLHASRTHVEFVPLAVREFVTINVSVDGSKATGAVLNAIEDADIGGKVVRLVIEGTAEGEAMLDDAQIQRALTPALRATVTKRVEREQRMRLGEVNYHEMTPLQLLEAYLESKGTGEEDQEALLAAAGELMKEG